MSLLRRHSQRRNLARLRRSCEARLTALALPAARDIAGLCALLSERRGRPLHLAPIAMRAEQPCGLWIAANTVDFIIYEAKTTRPHQEHIIAHELAHIICGHRSGSPLDDATARLVFPDLNPALVRDMLARTTYSETQEQEAEMTASLIIATRIGSTTPHLPSEQRALGGALGITQTASRL
ncbi:toxin [Streptomyces sp. NPDC053474]|uniref:toxin n=1 Tax=Streptomyces sp. NPDC053474 TaxID=3365704 RepID=UPI0037D0DEF8